MTVQSFREWGSWDLDTESPKILISHRWKRLNPYWRDTVYLKDVSISMDWLEQVRSRGVIVEDAVRSSQLVVHQEDDVRIRKELLKAKAGWAGAAQGLPSGGIHATVWAWLRICFFSPSLVFFPLYPWDGRSGGKESQADSCIYAGIPQHLNRGGGGICCVCVCVQEGCVDGYWQAGG